MDKEAALSPDADAVLSPGAATRFVEKSLSLVSLYGEKSV